jgi:hypothetical protein
MSNRKGSASPVVRVRPSLGKPRKTSGQIVDTTHSSVAAMKASSEWANAADVQTAVAKWSTAADEIAGNAAIIAQLKDQLKAAVAKQRTLTHTWSVCTQQVLTSVDAYCANSPVKIQSFGLVAVTATAHALLDVPTDIASSPGPLPGESRFTWARGLAIHGFLVQHATDTGNPASFSPATPCSKVRFTFSPPPVLPSGSSVYLRVAAIDPHAALGQSPWSAWVAGTIR